MQGVERAIKIAKNHIPPDCPGVVVGPFGFVKLPQLEANTFETISTTTAKCVSSYDDIATCRGCQLYDGIAVPND